MLTDKKITILSNSKNLISPFEERLLQPHSYDVTLGDELMMKLWREGYIEKFKMVMVGSSYATNFYMLGELGKKILLERNFKDYDLNFLEKYEVQDEVHFHSFEHHYLVAEFASLEHLILEGKEIKSLGEMKAGIYYGENKNLTIKPDFATLLQKDGKDLVVNSEFEVSVKSQVMKLEKLSKYVSYKEISGDDFLLRFIFSNPIREIGYWSWTARNYPQALEKLNICSTCMNLVNDENDLLKNIYYFPKLENVPHIPVGTNRWDERFEVKRGLLN